MNAEQVDNFERIQAQMHGLYVEVGALSKKKPDDPINKFKLGLVNQILDQANKILGEENRPFQNFEQFDEVELPSNSDVVLIISQYLDCLERLRVANITHDKLGKWYWLIDNERSARRAASPRKFT
jgi:hypothetical protein